jgi:hypothetical protein
MELFNPRFLLEIRVHLLRFAEDFGERVQEVLGLTVPAVLTSTDLKESVWQNLYPVGQRDQALGYGL